MRDGVNLIGDLYLPTGAGPFPVLLQRTPYGRQASTGFALMAAARGYAVVMQDTRGRWDSEGEFRPFVHEADDGYDTCAWICAQSWANGRIGMFGGSYVGLTQWQAALAQAPGLQAISPAITAADYHAGWTYQGGAYQLGFNLCWATGLMQDTAARLDKQAGGAHWLNAAMDRNDTLPIAFDRLPLMGDELMATIAPYYDQDWLAHPDDDLFWQSIRVEGRNHELDLACFHSGGWHDIFLGGTLRSYIGMRNHAKTATARENQWLFINPRDHYTFSSHLPMGNYDPGTRSQHGTIDFDGLQLRFFNRILRDSDDALSRVKIFIMGEDAWRDETEWPLARAIPTDLFLQSRGNANTRNGDGRLTWDAPAGDEPPDVFTYDPHNPVQTFGGPLCGHPFALNWGRRDQRELELRPDILCYSSTPLAAPIEITGPISVHLFATSSATDTDFTAKLVDVAPDGTANNVIDGIIRARYRTGPQQQVLITPGEVNEYTIDLTATSFVFATGHQIRLEISSSNFPRFDRNPNHGGVIATATERDFMPADQTILHDAAHPSRLSVCIVPAAGTG